MSPDELLPYLCQRGLVQSPTARLKPLSGGVSSDIWLVEDGDRRFVVKQARPKLHVPGDWYADVSRNHYEQEFLAYVAGFLPEAVPCVLHADAEHGFFTMEYLGDGYVNWKSKLLEGKAEPGDAVLAAEILSAIHRHSWNDNEARQRFNTVSNFQQLRIDPYLLTTAKRHPRLRHHFKAEAQRLAETSLCLVHGDFSPKNILIGPKRMVLLDCEVAWFGDPAFDVAFLLNHFLLKALHLIAKPEPFLELANAAWRTYCQGMSPRISIDFEGRICRLLLMLLLARIDGKSPVEYLQDEVKFEIVREFVFRQLPRETWLLGDLLRSWSDQLGEAWPLEPTESQPPLSGPG